MALTPGRMALVALVMLGVAACAKRPPSVSRIPIGEERGLASWYGEPYHGRTTASGEVYDMYRMTAAHRTYPFGTRVQVTNLDNGHQVQVRVNDRGPFIAGRIIDLSLAAAQRLGMVVAGVVPVRLQVLSRWAADGRFTVQAAAFAEEERAQELKRELERSYSPVKVSSLEGPWGPLHRVQVGLYRTETEAGRVAAALSDMGFRPFVIRIDR